MSTAYINGVEQRIRGPVSWSSLASMEPDLGPVLLDTGEVVYYDTRSSLWVPWFCRHLTYCSHIHKDSYVAGSPPAGWAETGTVTGGSGSDIVITATPGNTSDLAYTISGMQSGDYIAAVICAKGVAGGASDSNRAGVVIGNNVDLNDYIEWWLDSGSSAKALWYGGIAGDHHSPWDTAKVPFCIVAPPDNTEDSTAWLTVLDDPAKARTGIPADCYVGAAASDYVQLRARNVVAGAGDTVVTVEYCAIYRGQL